MQLQSGRQLQHPTSPRQPPTLCCVSPSQRSTSQWQSRSWCQSRRHDGMVCHISLSCPQPRTPSLPAAPPIQPCLPHVLPSRLVLSCRPLDGLQSRACPSQSCCVRQISASLVSVSIGQKATVPPNHPHLDSTCTRAHLSSSISTFRVQSAFPAPVASHCVPATA